MKIFTRIPVWRELRSALGILTLLLIAASAAMSQLPITGRIDKVWTEERVKVGTNIGIRIHVKFEVKNAVGEDCRIRANFYTEDGNAIVPSPGASEYKDKGGHAVVTKDFKPPYATSDYLDTKLAMPYWVLNLRENNENKMKFFVAIRCRNEKVTESDWIPFSLRLGKAK